jgi:membrane protease YdiL (CAAX protease family)
MRFEALSKYNLDVILPVLLIVLAEGLLFIGNIEAAVSVHALNLTMLILSSIYIENRIYPAMMLLPLFRLLNIAMPVFFSLTLYSYSFVYAPMFIPIYFIMKERLFSKSEAGFTTSDFWTYLPLAVAIGFALGWGEYQILHPGVMVPDISIRSVLTLSIIMILFVGFVEEFIFRSAMQTVLEERLGPVAGLLAASILFGAMHSGYHLPQELVFVSAAGVVFGLLFWLTRSLPIIALAHGVTNISLFLVVPAFPWLVIYIVILSAVLFVLAMALAEMISKRAKSARNI